MKHFLVVPCRWPGRFATAQMPAHDHPANGPACKCQLPPDQNAAETVADEPRAPRVNRLESAVPGLHADVHAAGGIVELDVQLGEAFLSSTPKQSGPAAAGDKLTTSTTNVFHDRPPNQFGVGPRVASCCRTMLRPGGRRTITGRRLSRVVPDGGYAKTASLAKRIVDTARPSATNFVPWALGTSQPTSSVC